MRVPFIVEYVFMSAGISQTAISRHSRVVETGASGGTEGDGCVTEYRFENEASQREKREVLRNDTYLSRAASEIEPGGRFAKLHSPTITGALPGPQVPQQPPTSPFHHDPVGSEPPLGFAVDEMVPVGTEVEIERSIAALDEPASHAPAPSPAVEREAGPPPLRRRA